MNIPPENVPRQTLFVANLADNVKRSDLLKNLFELLVVYGDVLDIRASYKDGSRGHAFVCFRDISAATNALRQLQGFPFLGRKLRIQYARSNAESISKYDGSFKRKKKEKAQSQQMKKAAAAASKAAATSDVVNQPPMSSTYAPSSNVVGVDSSSSSNILYVENLPAECTQGALEMLFRQYPGYVEVRLIEGRNVAFVEYEDELQAGIAVSGLQGFKLTETHALRISHAKQ
eukprot:Filipodium_phascolosomae@DN2166_c0_g1_i1.p1